MKQYHDLCKHILENGIKKEDRTGTGTLSVFGYQMRFDLQKGFPLMTTKKVPFRVIAEELLWFLRGQTNVKELIKRKVNIWNHDAYRYYLESEPEIPLTFDEYVQQIKTDEIFAEKYGDLGDIYGKQWRDWNGIDQISNVIQSIKNNPDSRRHLVSGWNVGELHNMALPPCHTFFQFYVYDGKLDCQLYQRSGDVFLGVPFNIASYSLLTHMIADICDLEVGEFIHTLGDAHIYLNHIEQVREQLSRKPKELPELIVKKKVNDPAEYEVSDFEVKGYEPYPVIKGKVSVGL